MANEHIINNNLEVTGSIKASAGFFGDGSGLTGITATVEWDGSRNGDADITGSLVVSGSNVNVDFLNTGGVSGSFSGSFQGNGSGLTNLNLNGYQASGSTVSGSFSGSFEGNGSGLTDLNIFPYNGNAVITGSLTVSSSIIDFTDSTVISGSIFSGSFVGDGSGLTDVTAEWDGTRNGNAEITGSFIVSGSTPTIQLLGDTTIDQNIEISNRNQINDIAIGYQALPNSTVNRDTIAIGYRSGFNSVSGSANTLIGQCAGYYGVRVRDNIAIGDCALFFSTGLDVGSTTNQSANIAIGNKAMFGTTTGFENIAIGCYALTSNTTGNYSVAIGDSAGRCSTEGDNNTFVGSDAGGRNITSGCNVFVGSKAGLYSTGRNNTAVGYQALRGPGTGISGACNTAIGYNAGLNASTTSFKNLYVGVNAGPSTNTTQNCQLYIGVTSGETPLIRGDFSTGVVTINSCLKVAQASGSFVGDGSGLTGLPGSTSIYEIGSGANSIQPASASFNADASGDFSTIVGGFNNLATGNCSFIGGGSSNTVEQTYGSIVGGSTNCITGTGDSNTILNGFGNTISGSANSVIAGATNTLADPGASNFVFGQGMTIGAGSSIGTSNLYTQNIHITGSTTANGILKISRRTTTPSPAQEGMIIASGSAGASVLYYYDGSTWNALF